MTVRWRSGDEYQNGEQDMSTVDMKSKPSDSNLRACYGAFVIELEDLLANGVTATPRPWFSGAVGLVRWRGETRALAAVGQTARYADLDGTPAPEHLCRPVTESTLFDLASITKLFVTTTLLTLVEEGRLDLDEPIATWLPSFRGSDRTGVTLRRLLTHTSGLPALLSLWTDWPDREARAAAVLNAPLVNPPGTTFEYSCVGYLVAGLLATQVTGRPLPELVRDRVCGPLGLVDTGYLPSPSQVERTAATEYQPYVGRGMVRGSVHDENSWSLGGTGGNAGIFGTAAELARFGEMLRGHGAVDGVRVLSEDTVAEMTRDQLPASIEPGFRHGLGVRIADPQSMGVLAGSGDAGGSAAFGHTGFTGTSLVVDSRRELVVVVLTNRVHPSRDWSDVRGVRCGVAALAASIAEDPNQSKVNLP
ncbi:serine hydrolase domain-containing protein [Dactylosporangium darangshiense]|uniref:serine hydrolase domain-containing protein n=1 Tax=Dactylosporangium darangshiense TaxID=579108 RepID=UPI00363A4F4A